MKHYRGYKTVKAESIIKACPRVPFYADSSSFVIPAISEVLKRMAQEPNVY